MPLIMLTGGGTAGHVTPNIALIAEAQRRGWQIHYVGSVHGIEREMIEPLNIPYHAISSGKLRRYFSWENFVDPFRVLMGFMQGLILCAKLKPDLLFSKGGFVSVPIVIAAWLLRIPVISHESDITPGLANRIAYPFCRKICVAFEATVSFLPSAKVIVTGTPIRESILRGDKAAGLSFIGLADDKPLLLVFGGSLGAAVLNAQVRSVLDELLETFNVMHVTGAGNLDSSVDRPGYVQLAFVAQEFGDLLAAAAVVVSRAGANSLYELLALRKPHLLVPLTGAASRGDQLANAETFEHLGYSQVIHEEAMTNATFLSALRQLYEQRTSIVERLSSFEVKDSVNLIANEIGRQIRTQPGA